MGLFDLFSGNKIEEPIFVKDFEKESNLQLAQLNDLLEKVGDDQKGIVEEQLKKLQYGLVGEKNVAYELKNSFLPIVCLHNIRIEFRSYIAQFDFIVITRKCIFILETKALSGDIIIENTGNFIRVFHDYKGLVYKKEGMNSPVSQNEKHVDILKRFLAENKYNKNIPIISLILLANPKSIVDMKYAKKEIKQMIIKHDQIKSKFSDILNDLSTTYLNDKSMIDMANFIADNDQQIEYDYVKKFNLKIEDLKPEVNKIDSEQVIEEEKSLDDRLYDVLKSYRYKKAKEKNIQLYFIFNNNQLSELVLKRPKNKEEFVNIPGFGEKKYEDYGRDIIYLINNYDKDNIEINEIQKHDEDVEENTEKQDDLSNDENNPVYLELKKYRYEQSKKENIKPYFLYNNEQLKEICLKLPKTKEELLNISGFGEKKFEKYGESILNIIIKHDH